MLNRIFGSFRSNLIAGLLTLAPFGAVLWIILWLWAWLMDLSQVLPDSLNPKVVLNVESAFVARLIDFGMTLAVLAVILALVWLVGLISRNYLGRKIVEASSRFVMRVPVLRAVYTTLEQLLRTFATSQSKNFRRVVLLEYPRAGLFTLAFVTGERDRHPLTGQNGKFLTIYVPTTPNPTSGFYLTVAAADVRDVELTVEQALKEIISMGIVYKTTE